MSWKYNELQHHGVKGMKWGIRRYQNPDGTLTEAGKKRYFPTSGLDAQKAIQKKALKKTAAAGAVQLGLMAYLKHQGMPIDFAKKTAAFTVGMVYVINVLWDEGEYAVTGSIKK